ncbi:MAG: tRNA (N6-threonylcarbamoyladenosine(37)-N6)-methyltransferase TrmO [Clostridia bacterium]|nr:tRNA (N6-threonylcarbamoyladenosine(37)-N6)-methyltransferase TrmO [Clostridia bacterium]
MKTIAKIKTDFPTKFGIPRQSGLVEELKGMVIFEPEYRNSEALRGLEDFSHIWLLWEFSEAVSDKWSPTVRPPKLGGNVRKGVFATRSPFRPNSIGLSSVKLESIEHTEKYGTVLIVSGADLMDGTPIVDIKPYVPYSDCHTEAVGGFAKDGSEKLIVVFPEELRKNVPAEKLGALIKVLELDPRPAYQNDPDRIYGFGFAGMEIRFKVFDSVLTVTEVSKYKK